MWTRFYCLLLLAVIVADAASIDFPLDPKKIEDNGFILQSRLQMGNIIESLSESQKALTKASLEMIERQEKQETKFSELEENRKHFSNLDERQEKLETKLLQFIEKSEKSFVNLEKRQDKLEAKLSEFMEKSEKYFSNLEEKQLSPTVESTENNLTTIKNGQIPGNSNGGHNLYKYVEWTTVARRYGVRQGEPIDFNRNWTEYQNGFGDTDGEFFIGLEKLHNLTTEGEIQELVIILEDDHNEKRTAKYDNFKIGNAEENYELLELGEYSGDGGDGLRGHKNMKFSTYDRDNDRNFFYNCAEDYKGGWWFDSCINSYFTGPNGHAYEFFWDRDADNQLSIVEMKIRAKF